MHARARAQAVGRGPGALAGIYVSATGGKQVPLDTVARVTERSAPLVINHIGQFPAATISFNLAHGASLGDAVKAITQAERQLGVPASIATRFQGAALAFEASLANTLWLFAAAFPFLWTAWGSFKVEADFFSRTDWMNAILGPITIRQTGTAFTLAGYWGAWVEQEFWLSAINTLITPLPAMAPA